MVPYFNFKICISLMANGVEHLFTDPFGINPITEGLLSGPHVISQVLLNSKLKVR